MKKVLKIFMWIVIVAIFGGTFYFLWQNSRTPEDMYATVKPADGDIVNTTILTGKIEPRDEIAIKPQISGIISEINVEAGQMVSQGDVIAHIKVIPDASSLSSAQSRINSAKIECEDARLKYDRNKALYEKKVISREEYETSLKNYDKAKEELTAAEDTYRIVREGVSQYNAKESNTLVRATITGLVLDVPVKVGSSVIQANTMNDGTTVATIADMSNLIFKGSVDETEVGKLSVGMPMEISVGALPELHPLATIEYISPKGTNTSGANTFEIKAALTDLGDAAMRAGYSANATVKLAEANGVLTVPESTVIFENDSTFVYLQTDTVPKPVYTRHPITTGLSDGVNIEVKDGLNKSSVIRGAKIENKN